MAKSKAPAGTPATRVLSEAGVPHTVHAYTHVAGNAVGYGLEAAAALGVEPARVFKTLVADLDGRLVVGVVPVDAQLDLKALAEAAGGKKAAMAQPAVVERTSGYVVGGVSPLGQRKALPTYVDASALAHDTILVSAGKRGLDVELPPQALLDLTNGRAADIARR
jgi:Cys-tRNA(Pro)/Cys-tRNA(Cys) deacylase